MKQKVLLALRLLYAVFLIGTGIMTLRLQFSPPEWPESAAGAFLRAAGATGYLIGWVGIFKTLTGVLMLIPRTEKLAYLMALPYAVNILLWVTFVAHEWLLIGILDFLVSVTLIVMHFDSYRCLLSRPLPIHVPKS